MNEAGGGAARGHSISGAFVFLLLGVFAVFTTFMVLLGAQFYRSIVDETDAHAEERVITNYVLNTVRGNDSSDSISVKNIDGIDVLTFTWRIDGETYETMVYCYDGSIREYFAESEDDFRADYGEVICSAQSFEAEINGQLLTVEVVDAEGALHVMNMALRCNQEVAE